jgi:hypothetical protein
VNNQRDVVFISHANPEDDTFATWIAIRLARAGYRVWCDKTSLLAGEKFWNDIEEAIRDKTAKFIYVLSGVSNTKSGPRKELHLALNVGRTEQLKDFVVPVAVDDLPAREFNIHVAELNVLSFRPSWAGGLARLLEKLELDRVPKDPRFSPAALADWWRSQNSARAGITHTSSKLLSNWFRITQIPSKLFAHHVGDARPNLDVRQHAGFQQGPLICSFAERLGLGASVRTLDLQEFLERGIEHVADSAQAHRILVRLIASAWQRLMSQRGLPLFRLSGRRCAGVFVKDLVPNDTLPVSVPGARTTHRGIIGYKTIGPPDKRHKRHWHYGLSATVVHRPQRALSIRPHVFFSDDGKTLWESDKRVQRARRSQCKNWWNDDWRDRLLATMRWLALGATHIEVPVADEGKILVESTPVSFESPVSYVHRKLTADELDPDDDDDEDEDVAWEPREIDDPISG